MKRLITLIEKASLVGASLSALFMVLIVIIITVEIVLRAGFKTSTMISDEYSAYFFVAVVLLGLAFTLKEEGHIRITLVSSALGTRAGAALDIVATLAAMALTSFTLFYASRMVFESWQLNITADTLAETPIYLSQIVIPIGLALMDLQLAARVIRRWL
ncbi:MAG: TRAP transporter small permease subunit [Pseudomonadota bacterium]